VPSEIRCLPEVLPYAERLASLMGCSKVVFLGGGTAGVYLHDPELELHCLDEPGPAKAWLDRMGTGAIHERALSSSELSPEHETLLKDAVLVCAGVLDHVEDPEPVLATIKAATQFAKGVLIAGGDRELLRGLEGELPTPPGVLREWTIEEFEKLLADRGIPLNTITLGFTTSIGYERHSYLAVVSDESVAEVDLGGFLETGIQNLRFSGSLAAPGGIKKARVCMATHEIFGPAQCGGIGTANTSIVEALARAGHEVTILYNNEVTVADVDHWEKYYAEMGIRFVSLDVTEMTYVIPWQQEYGRRAWMVYQWILEEHRKQPWDAIHFPECNGFAFYTIQAKRCGIAFQSATICVGTHGSTRWANGSNHMTFYSLHELQEDFMERQSVEHCDALLAPSLYLVKWKQDRGWRVSKNVYQQQYVQPHSARLLDPPKANGPVPETVSGLKEIVFFGRLETRKGLVTTCDALEILEKEGELDGISVTFLGREGDVDGIMACAFLETRARKGKWGFEWQMLTNKVQSEAVEYLKTPGRLVVVPSLTDNSPNTVYECIGLQVPFITSRTGGIPELMNPRDVAQATFYHPEEILRAEPLAHSIRHALRHGIRPVRPAIDSGTNELVHLAWHESLVVKHDRDEAIMEWGTDAPLVSVCITAKGNAIHLEQALESVVAQDYPNVEIIVVADEAEPDRAKWLQPICEAHGGQFAIADQERPGVVRNRAAALAKGELLLFMEPDSLAKPRLISCLVNGLRRTEADVVTSLCHIVPAEKAIDHDSEAPQQTYFPLGGSPAIPLFMSMRGDVSFLIQKKSFDELGGYADDYRLDVDDYELLARAILEGKSLEVVPEELFWCRDYGKVEAGSTADYRSSRRFLRAYVDQLPEPLQWLPSYVRALDQHHEKIMVDYWEYKYQAGEGYDVTLKAFNEYKGWAEGEMNTIREHLGVVVEKEKEKFKEANSQAKRFLKENAKLEKRIAELESQPKRGLFKRKK